MTDQNAIRDDIAFMRALAEERRNDPLLGGSIMIAGGGLFGTTSLVIWIGLLNGLAIDSWIQLAWPVSGLLFFVTLFVLTQQARKAAA